MKTISQLLRTEQKKQNLTLAELARRIGVSQISVQGTLAGTSKPNKATVQRYAAFLSLPAEAITSRSAMVSKIPNKIKTLRQSKNGRRTDTTSVQRALKAIIQDKLALSVHTAPTSRRALIAKAITVMGNRG